MYKTLLVNQVLPSNMGRELPLLITHYASLLGEGYNLVLGIKKIIPTSWDEATVFVFGPDELDEALACILNHMPSLSSNPRFLPVCYVDIVAFIINEKRLDAYIQDESAENAVDPRLAGLIRSMKKQLAAA